MSEIEVGVCQAHERPYEGLCKTCNVIICPSCVMFGNHKKHDVLSLPEGAMYIRKEIDKTIFKGLLKKEFSETHILEIRENSLLMEKYKAETMKKIEDVFNGLIKTLRDRKNELINEILDKFAIEKDKIDSAENDWMCKQDISEKLTQFDKEQNDGFLLINSKFIMEGLRKLQEPTQFHELQIFNDLNTNVVIYTKDDHGNVKENREYSVGEINNSLNEYVELGKPNVLNYKY